MDLFSKKGRILNINSTTTIIGGEGSNSIWNEEPSGVKNSVNRVFTTISDFAVKSTRLYLNGQRMKIGITKDYTETGTNQITFNTGTIITSTDELIIDYDLVAP